MGQKDLSEKILVAYDDVFADIVNVLLFQGQQVIRPEELEEKEAKAFYKESGTLHALDRDVIKRWKKGEVRFACIGIENQTAVDPDMVFRVIGYDGAAYRAQLDEKGAAGSRYPVITIVLYFGYRRKWNAPISLLEKVTIPKGLDPYVHDYGMNLFEIAYLSEEQVEMFQSDFKIVADYFVQKRKNKEYMPSNTVIQHVDAVLQLLSIMENDSRFTEIQYKTDGKRVETMCDVLDAAIQKGMKQGIEQGIEQGLERGRNEERKELMSMLYKKGYTLKEIAQMTDRKEKEVRETLQLL